MTDDPPPFPPFRVARTERIYDSPWCGLRRDEIELADGSLQDVLHAEPASDLSNVIGLFADREAGTASGNEELAKSR